MLLVLIKDFQSDLAKNNNVQKKKLILQPRKPVDTYH